MRCAQSPQCVDASQPEHAWRLLHLGMSTMLGHVAKESGDVPHWTEPHTQCTARVTPCGWHGQRPYHRTHHDETWLTPQTPPQGRGLTRPPDKQRDTAIKGNSGQISCSCGSGPCAHAHTNIRSWFYRAMQPLLASTSAGQCLTSSTRRNKGWLGASGFLFSAAMTACQVPAPPLWCTDCTGQHMVHGHKRYTYTCST
jgi:hypothetical protein